MKNLNQIPGPRRTAFTLIELMVVIAIIGILAALVFPALRAAKISATRGKVNTELKQLEIAIEAYKARYGFYPPDTPGSPEINALFYELAGVAQQGQNFKTLDDRAQIQAVAIRAAFGRDGFMNCTRDGGGDDSKAAQRFLTGLRPDQYTVLTNGAGRFALLVCSVPWSAKLPPVISGAPEVNPWRYNSSNPTHNPKSFDLWVDIPLGGKVNRISNWNKSYEIVP